MALLGAHISMTLRYVYLGQQCENVFMYFTEGAVFTGVNIVQVAEAWWNDVKTVIRAAAPNQAGIVAFNSVVGRNLVLGGELGEYAIPSGERLGTRGASGDGNYLPSFVAGAIRLTVGNTTTRPGQKRFPFLEDLDNVNNVLGVGYFTVLDAIGDHIDGPLTLGAPAALGVLQPVVGGKEVGGFPTVYQDVLGHVTNPYASSQVSRKNGRGN